MSVGIIDVLKVIKIKEDHAELIAKASRAIDLCFQRLIKMPRIVKTGAIVGDRQFLNLLYGARIVNGYSGLIAERMQEEHLLLAKALHGAVDELDHAQHAVLRLQRHADDRARLQLGHLADALGKAGIVIYVRYDQGFAMPGHPAGDAFAHLKPNGRERLGSVPYGNGEVELVLQIGRAHV